MAVSSVKTGVTSISLLAGNAAFIPSYFDSISTVTVGAGGTSSITFSSIPSTYTHLQLRFSLLDGGGNGINFRVNSDTGANYSQHALGGNGSTTTSQGSGGTNSYSVAGYAVGTVATYPNVGIIDIFDYANTNKYKTSRSLFGADKNAASGSVEYSSGVWVNTAAINSINLFTGATINQYSSFALYGIKVS